MAITLTDQIQFSNITVPGKNMGSVIGKSNYKNTSSQSIDDEYSGVIQKPSPLINAVDIDWNGANISSAINSIDSTTHHNCLPEGINTINTTGELLKVIANLQAEFNKLYDDVHPPVPTVTYSISFDIIPNNKGYNFYTIEAVTDPDNVIPGERVLIYNNLTYEYKQSNLDIHIIKVQSGEEINFEWARTSTRFSFTMPEEDVNIIIGITEPESYNDGTGDPDPIPLKKYSIELDNTYLQTLGLSGENFHITANNEEITSEGIVSGYTVKIYLIDGTEYTTDDIIISSDQVVNIAFNSELNCWEFEMPSQSVRLFISKSYNGGVGGNDEPDPDPEPTPGPTPITYELDFAFNEPLSSGDFNIITNSINTIANGPINIEPDIIVSIYSTNDNYNSENINIISTSEDTEVTWLDDHWEFSMPASNITIVFDKKSDIYDGGIG